ncbi:M23 family metallopeptidase [Candidatus Parcubacteria bacterium]|nr:M23 family metallopeptidase [Candidatus Parcubacteria bacterium]
MSRIKKLVFLIGLIVLICGVSDKPAVWRGGQESPVFVGKEVSSSYWAIGVQQSSFPAAQGFSDLCLAQSNSLLGAAPYTLVSSKVLAGLGMDDSFLEREEIVEYIIEQGDTLSTITSKFEITLETLLWANNLSKNSVIKPGQKLLILPVSGIMHLVKSGDTLSQVVQDYKGDVSEVITANNLSGAEIFIGDVLVIPNGVKPKIVYSAAYTTPIASSYFICPILPPCRITQGLHLYNAIDFSHEGVSCGEPILAAASGVVQKTGYHRIAGSYIRIIHPNEVVTFYGHLSKIITASGQEVSQGEIIGYMGHSGYTIPSGSLGCHLHFEVRGARNPFAQ